MSFKVELKGMKALESRLKNLNKGTTKVLRDELAAFGQNTVADAKRLAPVDEGFLRNSITAQFPTSAKGFEVDIIVAADYAAYVEFGTRKFAAKYVSTLPPDWQAFAARFKGPGGGSFDEFVMRLVRWVKAKGIGKTYDVSTKRRARVGKQSAQTTAEADAYAIALHIMREGIRAQPFLYPAVEKNKIELIKRLKSNL